MDSINNSSRLQQLLSDSIPHETFHCYNYKPFSSRAQYESSRNLINWILLCAFRFQMQHCFSLGTQFGSNQFFICTPIFNVHSSRQSYHHNAWDYFASRRIDDAYIDWIYYILTPFGHVEVGITCGKAILSSLENQIDKMSLCDCEKCADCDSEFAFRTPLMQILLTEVGHCSDFQFSTFFQLSGSAGANLYAVSSSAFDARYHLSASGGVDPPCRRWMAVLLCLTNAPSRS